jgi:hypothetical protein
LIGSENMSKVFTLKYSSKLKSDSFIVSSQIRLGNILFIKVNDKDYTEAIKLTIHDLESRKIVYFFYNKRYLFIFILS